MSVVKYLRNRELTGVNESNQWLAYRNLTFQLKQEWFFEHADLYKLYSILCTMCYHENIAKKIVEIIEKYEREEIQSIVFTASRLENEMVLNNAELSKCIQNIKTCTI